MIIIENFEKVICRKFTCGDCIFGIPNKEYPNSLVDCKLYKTFYNISKEKCKRFRGLSDKTITEIKLKDIEIKKTKIDTHPRFQVPNPFFHNNRICPYCDKEVKRGSRLQIGKEYQWFHVECRRNHGFKNPVGFADFKPKLML